MPLADNRAGTSDMAGAKFIEEWRPASGWSKQMKAAAAQPDPLQEMD